MATEATSYQREAKPHPLQLLRARCAEHRLRHFWAEFEAKSPDLFLETIADCKIGIVEVTASSNSDITDYDRAERVVAKWASAGKDLDLLLKRELSVHVSRVFILQRLNSWSRMNATMEMFCSICVFCRITPRFLNIVTGFVRKFSSKDEDFMACYSDFSYVDKEEPGKAKNTNTRKGYQAINLCYNIRHFEYHGRVLEDPWPCRQSAIHQTYCLASGRSSWIVIQPPLCFESCLQDGEPISTPHPLGLHMCPGSTPLTTSFHHPLNTACLEGNDMIVQHLIGVGADVMAQDDDELDTPLHLALKDRGVSQFYNGCLRTVQWLLISGADMLARNGGDEHRLALRSRIAIFEAGFQGRQPGCRPTSLQRLWAAYLEKQTDAAIEASRLQRIVPTKGCRCNKSEKLDVALLKIRNKQKRNQKKMGKRELKRFEIRKKTSKRWSLLSHRNKMRFGEPGLT